MSDKIPQVRYTIFSIIAITLPFLVLFFSELALRYGSAFNKQHTLFLETGPNQNYLVLNPAFSPRYFRGFKPSVAFHPFEKVKSDSTLRIFVLGGSTAAGYPYQFGYSLSDAASIQLKKEFPNKKIEVVNLAMSAVNSYTLLDLTRRLVNYDTDGLFIYAGHNEYYGALGIAGSKGSSFIQAKIKRIQLRLNESAIYFYLRKWFQVKSMNQNSDETMMEQSYNDVHIVYNSKSFNDGLKQFQDNMIQIQQITKSSGIKVYMSTISSNLKDQPPLGSNQIAENFYSEAQELFSDGDITSARKHYLQAKEYDPVRFRAPDTLNSIIRQFSSFSNIHILDFAKSIPAVTKSGIEDQSVFTDHLHLNQKELNRLGRSFSNIYMDSLSTLSQKTTVNTSFENDIFDEAFSQYQVNLLKTGPPFTKPNGTNFRRRQEQVLNGLTGKYPRVVLSELNRHIIDQKPLSVIYLDLIKANQTDEITPYHKLQFYFSLIKWQPFNKKLIQQAAQFVLNSGLELKFTEYFWLYIINLTDETQYYNILGALYLVEENLEQSEHFLKIVEARDPLNPDMLNNLSQLYILRGDMDAAQKYFDRLQNLR